jgi:hypothetical protein
MEIGGETGPRNGADSDISVSCWAVFSLTLSSTYDDDRRGLGVQNCRTVALCYLRFIWFDLSYTLRLIESRRYLTTNKMQQLASGKLSEYMINLYLCTFTVFPYLDVAYLSVVFAGCVFFFCVFSCVCRFVFCL